MARTHRPIGGFPWDQAGYTFSIGWPRGYERPGISPYSHAPTTTSDLRAVGGARGGAGIAATQVTDAMKQGGLQTIDMGRGTLSHMAPRAPADVDRNERIRRSLP
jgi:hypothetical protein